MNSYDRNIVDKFCYIPSKIDGMNILTSDSTLVIDSGLGSDMFNIICATSQTDKESVRQGIEHFQSNSLPFCWWVGFEQDPSWLKDTLDQHHLRPSEEELMMVVRSDLVNWQPHPEALQLERLTERKQIEELIQVICQVVDQSEHQAMHAFFTAAAPILLDKDSDLRFFIGYVDQQPVACSSLFFSQGIASIFDVMVSPSMRGNGLGKAMTLAAMQEGAVSGSKELLLTATNDAKFLYEKLGFKAVKLMGVYN